MIVVAFTTLLCTMGIGFYVRFFVALCKDCTRRWVCYRVALKPENGDPGISDSPKVEGSVARAA